MSQELPVQLVRDGMAMMVAVGGPLFMALFVAGGAIGIFQAATQVNDPAVSFLPRVLVALGVCAALGGWMVERMSAFVAHALNSMAGASL